MFESHLIRVRPERKLVDPEYLYYFFNSPQGRSAIWAITEQGAGQAGIRGSDLEKVDVSVPSLDEQQRIVSILSSLDRKIELNRQMNATLEAMAQALFKSWFVDFDPVIDKALDAGNPIPDALQKRAQARAALGDARKPLPVAIQNQFPDRFVFNEELGWVPEGWDIKSLKQLTTKIGSGATPRGGSKVYQEQGTALIRSQNIYDSKFVWAGLARISDDAANQLIGVTVQQKDVLINITGASILRTCIVVPDALPARVNQHVAIVRAKPPVPPRFIHLHLLQPRTKKLLLGQNAGASREAVTKGHLEAVRLSIPSSRILEQFANLVDPNLTRADGLARQVRILASLRDTLLPKLLSGQLRIPEAEQQVAAAI